jgi:tetratricopeptide (TPR) repeat protein
MGVVLLARGPDGHDVAIKRILGKPAAPVLARFERERRLLSTLGREVGFVPLLDAGATPEGPYVVMPFLTGGTLRARLEDGQMALDRAIPLALALAAALARAHALGIVHRDLKPENVLFDADGTPLVADLGLAKHFTTSAPGASQSVALSVAGQLRGTFGYMAREQGRDAQGVGPQADVFSLGAIIYECLAGEPAFSGSTALEVLGKVERGEFAPLKRLRPDVPGWLARVVSRALATEPGDRFADAGELTRALASEGSLEGPGNKTGRARRAAPERGGLAGRVMLVACGIAVLVVVVVIVVRGVRERAAEADRVAAANDFLTWSSTQGDPHRIVERASSLDERILARRDVGVVVWRARQRVTAIDTLASVPPWGPADDRVRAAGRAADEDPEYMPAFLARARARLELAPLASESEASKNRQLALLRREELELAAREDLDQALKLTPSSADLHWRSARLLERSTSQRARIPAWLTKAAALDRDGATGAMAKALLLEHEDPQASLTAANAAVQLAHESGEAHLVRARARLANDAVSFAEVEADLSAAIHLDPSTSIEANALLARSLALVKHDLPVALATALATLQIDPRSSDTLAVRAFVRAAMNEDAEARKDLERIRILGDRVALASAAEARLLLRGGKLDEAFASAKQALELDPRLAPALVIQAEVLSNRSEPHARSLLDRAIAIDEKESRAFLVRAGLEQRAGHLDAARVDVESAVRIDPSMVEAWTRLAEVCFAQPAEQVRATLDGPSRTNSERAYEAASKAIELNPKLAPARIVRARIHARNGDHWAATKDAREVVLRCSPERPHEAWCLLADEQMALNDKAGALESYRKAAKTAPDDWPERERVLAAVEKLEAELHPRRR